MSNLPISVNIFRIILSIRSLNHYFSPRQLTPGTNWAFQADWCPRNLSILATSYFDRKVSVHSTQSLNVEALEAHEAATAQAAGASAAGHGTTSTSPFGMNAFGGSQRCRFV
jgi:hypothetical protein